VLDANEDYISMELDKQKRKLREISVFLEQQQQLLRLIVQKMEIKTEADDVDEGTPSRPTSGSTNYTRWTSPKIRKKLKSAVSFNRSFS
jgi:transient receptor potential cation channel subfamily A member 1